MPIGRNKCQISHRTDRHNHGRTSRKCGNFPINWEWKRTLPNQASDPVAQRRGETHNFGRVWKLAGEPHTNTRPGAKAAPTGGEEGPFFFTQLNGQQTRKPRVSPTSQTGISREEYKQAQTHRPGARMSTEEPAPHERLKCYICLISPLSLSHCPLYSSRNMF